MTEPKKPGRPRLDNVRVILRLPPDVHEALESQPRGKKSAFITMLVRAWLKRNKSA